MTARRWTWSRLALLAVLAGACGRGGRPKAAAAAAFTNPAQLRERAPEAFRARFETTAGPVVIEVHRAWAPLGADRFYNLVKSGYFDGTRFFRVISGFMVQFGIHGDPLVSAAWHEQRIADDPVLQSNRRGMVSFATAGPGTRTTQVFINYSDNSRLDAMGFAPFGQVVEGMDVVDRLYAGYGEGAPGGLGPVQGRIQAEGNAYLEREFPKLDQVRRATLLAPASPPSVR
jgi:peptidyl-prolyl cis-trans isomerase A (cyclophilin A)